MLAALSNKRAAGYCVDMSGHASDESELSARLARNLRHLREARGLTQKRLAELAGIPRATWANLESGMGNPTLSVLHRVAAALQVSLEELISRHPGQADVSKLLPDPIPGMEMERIELPGGGRMAGVPHTPGTREYLVCERGTLVLQAAGERFELNPGDLVAFRGDQKHSYSNPGREPAVGFSVVVLAQGL
jgi:transcriptional regulator with XRE-family HTH domain